MLSSVMVVNFFSVLMVMIERLIDESCPKGVNDVRGDVKNGSLGGAQHNNPTPPPGCGKTTTFLPRIPEYGINFDQI